MVASTVTLADYINTCRLLLHDANGAFYSDQELIQYINNARDRLARDTGILREIQTANTVTNQELYDLSILPNGAHTYDVMNINLYWGNSRVPLYYLPWTDFNAKLRYWQNYYSRPLCFSTYGVGTSFYLGPTPDHVYTLELDTVTIPPDLVNTTDVEVIPNTFVSPISYYACHEAKFKEQAFGESEIFRQQYLHKLQNVGATSYQRRIFSPYATMYR